jgi:hypothetical protein
MEQFNLDTWLKDKSRKVVTRSGHNVRILCTDQRGNMPIVALVEFETLDGVQIFYSDGKNENHREYDLFFADEELTEFEKVLKEVIEDIQNGDYIEEESFVFWKDKLLDLARKEIEKENSGFKPKFTYNEKDYSELGNKLIEFRNNTPLFSVSYRDGEGRKAILHYEKEILDLARKELELNYYTKVLDDRMVFKSELHATDLQTAYDMGKQDALKDLPKWRECKFTSVYPRIVDTLGNAKLCYKNHKINIKELIEKLPKE